MEIKSGSTTSEFRTMVIASLGIVIGAVVSLLVANNVVTTESGEIVRAATNLLIPPFATFVVGWIVVRYGEGRKDIKVAQAYASQTNLAPPFAIDAVVVD